MLAPPLALLAAGSLRCQPAVVHEFRNDGFDLLSPTRRELATESGRNGNCGPRNASLPESDRISFPYSGTANLVFRAGDNTSAGDKSRRRSGGEDPASYSLYEGELANGTETTNALLRKVKAWGKGLYDCYELNPQNLLLDVESVNVTLGAVGSHIVY